MPTHSPQFHREKLSKRRHIVDGLAMLRSVRRSLCGWPVLGRLRRPMYGDAASAYASAVGEGRGLRRVPYGYWKDRANRRRFLEEFAAAEGIGSNPEGWARVKAADIIAYGGGGLLGMYRNSLYGLLADVYSDEQWTSPTCGQRRPRGYWQSQENQRAFMDELADKLGITSPEQWADVSVQQLQRLGGGSLLNQHGGSLARLLRSVYGSEDSSLDIDVESLRKKMPNRFWQQQEHVTSYLAKLAAVVGVTEKNDWYRVSRAQMKLVKPSPPHMYGLVDLLRVAYPDSKWDSSRTASAAKKASQRGLSLAIRDIFAGDDECANSDRREAMGM